MKITISQEKRQPSFVLLHYGYQQLNYWLLNESKMLSSCHHEFCMRCKISLWPVLDGKGLILFRLGEVLTITKFSFQQLYSSPAFPDGSNWLYIGFISCHTVLCGCWCILFQSWQVLPKSQLHFAFLGECCFMTKSSLTETKIETHFYFSDVVFRPQFTNTFWDYWTGKQSNMFYMRCNFSWSF